MNGSITTKTWSGLFHQVWMPGSTPETIEAKISSEMPLPIPRWVISSPIHISRVEPAVRQITISSTLPKFMFETTLVPPVESELKRKT